MPSINTSITIAASPSAVRRVFLDFAAYPQWNPFITSLKVPDPAAPPGTPIELYAWKIFLDRSTVVQNDPGMFAWSGGSCGLANCMPCFQGYHYFRFEPIGEQVGDGETQQCNFVQNQDFKGFLSIFSFLYAPVMKVGFNKMNKALKVRVETLAAGGEHAP